jgi:hypothetical protein
MSSRFSEESAAGDAWQEKLEQLQVRLLPRVGDRAGSRSASSERCRPCAVERAGAGSVRGTEVEGEVPGGEAAASEDGEGPAGSRRAHGAPPGRRRRLGCDQEIVIEVGIKATGDASDALSSLSHHFVALTALAAARTTRPIF